MNQLIQVPFEGDFLHAIKTGDSEEQVFVSVRRVCEVFGLDRMTQQRKLQNAAWAVGGLKPLTGSDGKTYQQYVLSLKSLPLWLATISPGRVAKELADKLAKYQMQCRDVLYRHFFGVKEEKRLDIVETTEFYNRPVGYMPNAGLAQRLQKASELVEKYDRLQTLQNRIAAKRISIVIRLKEFGISLSHC